MSDDAEDPALRAAVDAFAPGDASLLEARALLRRTDHKLLTTADRLPALLAALADDHRIVLAAGERVAHYATTYLDSCDLRCFADHRRGRPGRTKLRWRDHLDRGVTTLEVKTKTGRGETRKARLDRPFLDHTLDGVARAFLDGQVPFAADQAIPVLENRFRRITLVAPAADERVTVDLDVRFSSDGRDLALGPWVVLEVKTGASPRNAPALRRFRETGLCETSFSKYAIGMAATHPGLRAGAIRPMIRRLGLLEAAC